MVVPGVVGDDHDPTTAAASTPAQRAQKAPTGLSVETTLGFGDDQAPVANPHRTEVTDAFARGGMAANRVANLRRDPHAAAAAVLLEVHLIQCPQIDSAVASEALEFFLPPPASQGRLARFRAVASAGENPSAGRGAGIGEPSGLRRTASAGRPTRAGHPTTGPAIHSRRAFGATPLPLSASASESTAAADRNVRLRSIRRNHVARNDAPSSRQCHVNRPAPSLPPGNSFPRPPAIPRAIGGRNARRGCDESRPVRPRSSLRDPKWLAPSCAAMLDKSVAMFNYL